MKTQTVQIHPNTSKSKGRITPAYMLQQIDLWTGENNIEQVAAWGRMAASCCKAAEISERYWAEKARIAEGDRQ